MTSVTRNPSCSSTTPQRDGRRACASSARSAPPREKSLARLRLRRQPSRRPSVALVPGPHVCRAVDLGCLATTSCATQPPVLSYDCCAYVVGNASRMEYVSRAPQPPLDDLIHDVYYLAGNPPYRRLTLPAAPAPLLIVNLGAPFHIRAGNHIQAAEYADGCVVSTPTRAWEFGYPIPSRSVGVHFKPWGLAPFLPMAAAELRDRPATIEQVWGQPVIAELRDRLAAVHEPHQLLTVLEEGLIRQLRETPGLDLVRRVSTAIAATGGTVAISDLIAAGGVSSTYLARSFKQIIGVTPKRLARAHRFSTTVLAIDPAEPIDWADLAARAGYFDQAHFGHEFREFTGFTPTRYVEVRRRFLREHPGHVLDGWPLPAD